MSYPPNIGDKLRNKHLLAIAISLFTFAPSAVVAQEAPPVTTPPDEVVAVDMNVEEVSQSVQIKKSLTYTKKPKATNKFWDKLAWCETNGDWKNGGNWAGGLGIAQSTWYGFGGREFAKSPHLATKEEQIIVAHRISTQGYKTIKRRSAEDARKMGVPQTYKWEKYPVGFNGWGALPCAGKPVLFHYDNFRAVLKVPYSFNERSLMVKDLQTYLRIKADGHYGAKTRQAHFRYLKKHKIPTKGIVPANPKSPKVGTVSTQSVKTDRSCPRYESLLKKYGLPVKDFTYIMWRESRCQEKVVSKPNRNGTKDYGLLQVNSSWKTVTRQVCGGKNLNVLLNRNCNLKVAKYLYENGGLAHWKATSGKG